MRRSKFRTDRNSKRLQSDVDDDYGNDTVTDEFARDYGNV
jgi:hypothetical protein